MLTLTFTITDKKWHNLTDLDTDSKLTEGDLYLIQINTGKLWCAPSSVKPSSNIVGLLASPADSIKIEYRKNLTWLRVNPANAKITIAEVIN